MDVAGITSEERRPGRRVLAGLVGAGVLTAALGVVPAGALAAPSAAPGITGGTEDLCPATMPLTKTDQKQTASLLRSYLGCRTSDDPGPSDPGKR